METASCGKITHKKRFPHTVPVISATPHFLGGVFFTIMVKIPGMSWKSSPQQVICHLELSLCHCISIPVHQCMNRDSEFMDHCLIQIGRNLEMCLAFKDIESEGNIANR